MEKSLSIISFVQIIILILGSFAIACIIGDEISVISASTGVNKGITVPPPTDAGSSISILEPPITGIGTSSPSTYYTNEELMKRALKNTQAREIAINPVDVPQQVKSGGWSVEKAINSEGYSVIEYNGKEYLAKGKEFWDASGELVTDKTLQKELSKRNSGWGKFVTSRKAYFGEILQSAGTATLIYTVANLVLPMLTDDKEMSDAASLAIAVGYFAGTNIDAVFGLLKDSWGKWIGEKVLGGEMWGISGGVWVGVAATIITFYLSYKKTEELKVQYTCSVWEPPTGGKNCERCNEGELPCTQYQCESLGQACELLNPGTTEEICAWKDDHDVTPPIIRPWEEALSHNELSYVPDSRVSHPNDRGVYIVNETSDDGCMKAFTPFSFGVILDEPGKCRVDMIRKEKFEDMNLYFGGSSTLKYNHTQNLILPSAESLAAENITLENGGNFELYVMCQDANGNPKSDSPASSFVFKYCVDDGPDLEAPIILTTSIESGEPIAFNQSEVEISIDLNEPAECRWNHDTDTSFSNMYGNFTCSNRVTQINGQAHYTCTTTLSSIRDMQKNTFYFRCKDKPRSQENDRNENAKGYEFILYGTQPLYIDYAEPNETTVKDSTAQVRVTLETRTLGGYKDGEALCSYSESCWDEDGPLDSFYFIGEDETDFAPIHEADIFPVPGDYTCNIMCVDRGGNSDSTTITYTVETDEDPPTVVRMYHDRNYLRIATDESSECVFGINNCVYDFDEGIKFKSIDSEQLEHFTDWDPDKTLYIKCRDKFTNQPAYNICSIIAKLSEDFSE